MYHLAQIAEITNTSLVGKNRQGLCYFLHDSRELQFASETLFIALKTKLNDGHKYIPDLIEAGVRSFLVSDMGFDYQRYEDQDVSFILSESPLLTIQQLAAYHRQQFSIPVIGITGSNGKTMVKEWLYQLLKTDYNICRSPKSYNSQIGVPLSVLNLNESHTLAIFEAGISLPGEMESLSSIIRPTIGLLTSLGSAHDEGFESREHKLSEKIKLLEGSDKIIVNGIERALIEKLDFKNVCLLSEQENADFQISYNKNKVTLKGKSQEIVFELPFSDIASVYNASTCAVLMLQLGLKAEIIVKKLSTLQAVALRLELKNGIHNSLIINDYYNSDLDSIKIALNYLQQQNQKNKKVVIVSDIEQSGMSNEMLYHKLSELLSQHQIDLLIGVGTEICKHRFLFKANSVFYTSTNEIISQFNLIDYQLSDSTILLKGARSFGFENLGRLLQLKSHDTIFEISLNNLRDNLNYYRSLLLPNVKLMCMVKAMAYGSGSSEIARNLQHLGADYLAVAYADEGVELRKSKITLPIMVMSPEEDAFDDIINYHLEPELYSMKSLNAFVQKLDNSGVTEAFPVHIKIDTGMHRLGFEEQQLEVLIKILKNSPQLKVKSVFSHLAASDNPKLDDFTQTQIATFESECKKLEQELGYSFMKHICNSGAISRFKSAHYDMVRLGIGMYGIGVDEKEQSKLQNVGCLKTKITQIKQIETGQTVGYNRSGKIEKQTKIAIIPIGYADGYNRLLGNGNYGVYINGTFCKTVGNVCMDMSMIDVTEITCKEGDDVIVFENAEQIQSLSKALHTIPYEILTNVSGRVKRIYIKE